MTQRTQASCAKSVGLWTMQSFVKIHEMEVQTESRQSPPGCHRRSSAQSGEEALISLISVLTPLPGTVSVE